MDLNFNFLPTFLLIVVGVTAMTIAVLDSRAGKGNPDPMTFAAAFYALVSGTVIMFVPKDIRSDWILVLVLMSIVWMGMVYALVAAVRAQIKINENWHELVSKRHEGK